jgi:hypothetical protein
LCMALRTALGIDHITRGSLVMRYVGHTLLLCMMCYFAGTEHKNHCKY